MFLLISYVVLSGIVFRFVLSLDEKVSNLYEAGSWCAFIGSECERSDGSVFWLGKGFNVMGGLVRRKWQGL